MKSGWGRWRGYMDEIEEVMRSAGEHLDETEATIAQRWERDLWRPLRREKAEVEILRRALDIPFMRRLIEVAWRVGPGVQLAVPDFAGRAWREGETTDSLRSADRFDGASMREAPSPPPDEQPPARLRAAERALAERSRSMVVVLDNLVDPRNASAVVRTAESLGLQDIHFVQEQGRVALERSVTMRADRWMDLHWHQQPESAIGELREQGYRILVSDYSPGARPLEEVPLQGKIAVAFGSEQSGVGEALREAADEFFFLPSAGFTAYLNVSVMAAIALYALDRRMREAGLREPLSGGERASLRRAWYAGLARGNTRTARRYLGWAEHPPEPAPPRGSPSQS